MPRQRYTPEQVETFISRANEFMIKRPEASRARVAVYSGVSITILEKYEKEGKLKLPEKMKLKGIAKSYTWQNTLGSLSGR
jgi:hypothetical protein